MIVLFVFFGYVFWQRHLDPMPLAINAPEGVNLQSEQDHHAELIETCLREAEECIAMAKNAKDIGDKDAAKECLELASKYKDVAETLIKMYAEEAK